MITVQFVTGDGVNVLSVTGHAEKAACDAVTAVVKSCAMTLSLLAREWPADLNVTVTELSGPSTVPGMVSGEKAPLGRNPDEES